MVSTEDLAYARFSVDTTTKDRPMAKTSHELDYLELGYLPDAVGWVCKCGKKGKAKRRGNQQTELDLAAIKNHEAHVRREIFGAP